MFQKVTILIAMLLGVSVLYTCDSVNVEEENSNNFFESAQMIQVESLELGYFSNYVLDQKYGVIRSEPEFRNFWDKLHSSSNPLPEIPQIDFNDQMVIVSTMGTRSTGGYKTKITKAGILNDQLGIKIENTSPGAGCVVTQVVTNPYHITSVDKIGLSVTFFVEEITRNCTG